MTACLPLSRKYSAIAQPVYGARNCKGAASEAVAATIVVYFKQSFLRRISKSCATVERFWPTATYKQYKWFLVSGDWFTDFWFKIVSMAMAVFPVCLSPMMSSRWPRPTGMRLSTAFSPVVIGSCTLCRGMMPGAFNSTRRRCFALIGPKPSIGVPSASTTRPSNSSPMGTSTMVPVHLTLSPSTMSRSSPKTTTPTLSVSRLRAMPLRPLRNSTISPALTPFKP
mmetsp:Transcript_105040/g.302248  ORF Transcript_105040/g.302248 Transcript_105040/m.302248 type:complete len:225 (+) Transcript_105040:552-1226(+)